MQYAPLGKTGLNVSKICYGSLTLGPLQAALSPERAGELLAFAFANGINMLDTAQYYNNYPHIKEGLKRWKGDVIISSKCYAYTREGAIEAVEEARKGLDRDVIDIFMLHEQESIYTLRGHKAALDYFYDCKAKGIIKAVGTSTHHVAAVRGAIEIGLDVIHPIINIEGLGIADGSREDMEAALRDAYDAGIGIYTMKSLGGGNLFKRAEECLSYSFALPFASSCAIGMQSEEEISANIYFSEHGKFPESDKKLLESKKRRMIFEDWCIKCGNCEKKCFQKAIKIEENAKTPTIDQRKCVFCGYCGKMCPVCAIKVI